MVARVPERTCVGCRRRSPKADLLRLVRAVDGSLVPGATAPGRGVYVHRSSDCLEAALRGRAIERALGTGVGPDEARKLRGLVGRMHGNG